jgi:hypothetical protein
MALDPDQDKAIVYPAVAQLVETLLVEGRQAERVAVIEAQPNGGVGLVDVLSTVALCPHGLKLQLMPGDRDAVGDN